MISDSQLWQETSVFEVFDLVLFDGHWSPVREEITIKLLTVHHCENYITDWDNCMKQAV